MLSKYAIALVRTFVPIAVGYGVNFLARFGLHVSDENLVADLSAAVPAVYYAVVHKAEARWPKAGWLLGYAATPAYPQAKDAPLAPAAPVAPVVVPDAGPAQQGA